jgi:hypothetical protein
MLSRSKLATISMGIALVAFPLSSAHAQIRPSPAPPMPPRPILNAGGTGPFAVVLKIGTATTSFGNATTVTFTNPVGTPTQIKAGQGTLGTAVVQFAANNQPAQALGQTACFVQGCAAELIVTYTAAQGTTVYTLKGIRLTQYQLGTAVTATFSYLEYMYQTSARDKPARATYNTGTAVAN